MSAQSAGLRHVAHRLAAALAVTLRADESTPPARPMQANYTETIPGSDVRFEMVAIPGGESLRGSPPGEKGRGD